MEVCGVVRKIRTERGIIHLYSYDFIGKGTEATVYRKGNTAYKCYHPFFYTDRLSLEEVQKLRKLSTSRILLPQEILWSPTGKFKGYTTKYVEDYGIENILQLPTDFLIDEFHRLKQDCTILGEQSVLVADFLPGNSDVHNYSFHDGVYFFDPGKFRYDTSFSSSEIIAYNSSMVDDVIYHGIIMKYGNFLGSSHQVAEAMKEWSCDTTYTSVGLMDYIESDIHEKNLGEYIKRKVLKK